MDHISCSCGICQIGTFVLYCNHCDKKMTEAGAYLVMCTNLPEDSKEVKYFCEKCIKVVSLANIYVPSMFIF